MRRAQRRPSAAAQHGRGRAAASRGAVSCRAALLENDGPGADAPIVVDGAETAHETIFRFLDSPPERTSRQLPDRLVDVEKTRAGPGLTQRKHAAAGVERKISVQR